MRVRVCVNRGKKTSAGFENAYSAAAGDLSVFPPAATCEPLTSRLIFLFVYIITAAT